MIANRIIEESLDIFLKTSRNYEEKPKKLLRYLDEKDKKFAMLFEQALLAEGGQLSDPAAFVQRVNRLLLGK